MNDKKASLEVITMDEVKLIRRAKCGDREAFASLYMLYRDRLYRYAYFKLRSRDDAEDAVSDCVVRVFTAIRGLKSEKAFPAWIFRILYRVCAEMIDSKIKHAVEVDRADVPIEDSHLSVELSEALDTLSPDTRDIVLLSVIAGFNSREISSLTGTKASTVRSKLSRGLEKMREYLS